MVAAKSDWLTSSTPYGWSQESSLHLSIFCAQKDMIALPPNATHNATMRSQFFQSDEIQVEAVSSWMDSKQLAWSHYKNYISKNVWSYC